jgi:hypothetical protein
VRREADDIVIVRCPGKGTTGTRALTTLEVVIPDRIGPRKRYFDAEGAVEHAKRHASVRRVSVWVARGISDDDLTLMASYRE